MAYRYDKNTAELVIDGFEKGIAPSPYEGIANIRNLNTNYYPGVAYVNYKRLPATLTATTEFFAGSHSTNVSNNQGWLFTGSSSPAMTNPVQKAVSPVGLIYILDDSGQIWKQSAVNSTSFGLLESGSGRIKNGASGLAYWDNYLVVFGNGVVEFCGDGTGDSTIISTNWNALNREATNTTAFTTNFALNNDRINFTVNPISTLPHFTVNDRVRFTTTVALPNGLLTNTTYYVISIDTTASYLKVSTTLGGSAQTFSDDGTGTHTITDISSPIPFGNCTSFSGTFSGSPVGATSMTITSYVNPSGTTITANWEQPTGLYNIVMTDNTKIPANFTYGSSTVNFLSPLIYISAGTWSIQLLDTTVTNYRPYVSKVDGSLYFCNGQFVGRIAESVSPNLVFNPGLISSFNVSYGVFSIPEQFTDSVVALIDLKSQMIVAGQQDFYTWDYLSAATSAPTPVGEKIYSVTNILNTIYILAGNKGSIYVSNGYSAQFLYKLPDYIAGVIDPIWSWGDVMTHRSKLYFQAIAQSNSGTNLLAGIFSLIVSPSVIGEVASGFTMEAQNSYGLTPSSGALANGLLIDNQRWSTTVDSYYSAWSNGATTGGIDYNDTTLWQNFEPIIETDIIPIGTILDIKTLGNIHFKLDRPMTAGDQIRLYWRASLTDSYTFMGTTTTAVLSDYYASNVTQAQWVQFQVQFKSASSSSSRIPLREIRIQSK